MHPFITEITTVDQRLMPLRDLATYDYPMPIRYAKKSQAETNNEKGSLYMIMLPVFIQPEGKPPQLSLQVIDFNPVTSRFKANELVQQQGLKF